MASLRKNVKRVAARRGGKSPISNTPPISIGIGLGGGGGGTPPVTCARPLDDNGTLSAAFGFGHLPMTAPSYQSFTYVQTGSTPPGCAPGNTAAIALPSNMFSGGATDMPTSGHIVAQLKITEWEGASTPDSVILYVALVASFFDSSLSNLLGHFSVGFRSSGGDLYIRSVINGGSESTTMIGAGTSALNKSLALYISSDGSIGWTADGVDRGILGTGIGATNKLFFGLAIDDNIAGSVGATISGDFITSASSITEPVPSGSVDLCGNPV